MDRKEVEKILIYCRDIEGEIKLYHNLLKDYEDTYYSMSGGGSLDGMPRGKNKVSNPTESLALNIPDSASAAMRDLRRKIEQRADLKAAILKELDKLPLCEKEIVYQYYIKDYQWAKIRQKIYYSERQGSRIRNRAIEKLAILFEKNTLIKKFNYPLL